MSILFVLLVAANAQLIEKRLDQNPRMNTAKELSSVLSQMKKSESSKDWSACTGLGRKAFKAHPELRGWIAISWLKCARMNKQSKNDLRSLEQAVDKIDSSHGLIGQGPWSSSLATELLKSRFEIVESLVKLKSTQAWKYLDALLAMDKADRDTRAKALFWAGELSYLKGQLPAARQLFGSSLNERETRNARERLAQVLAAMNIKEEKQELNQSAALLSESEKKFEERLASSLKSNDFLSFVHDGVDYLNEFPGGKNAKMVSEKILEIYQSIFENLNSGKDTEKHLQLRDKAFALMSKLDSQRLLEWARFFHRRSDFVATLRMSEEALSKGRNSPNATLLLYFAGRSAQFLGDYKKALQFFNEYLERHNGGEDVNEVLFRLALSQIRLGEFEGAVASFEKLLLQKNIDRYELSARYWLIRSLQALKNPRAVIEAEQVILNFPFSYYGIRLRAERDKDSYVFPTNEKELSAKPVGYFMTSSQNRSFYRIESLAGNGWYAEAQSEIANFSIPQEANLKALLAKRWSKSRAFPVVIRLINDAGDLDPALRSTELIRLSYPKVFSEKITQEAKAQGLSPYLIKSLIRQESAFGVTATSRSNALGLMQLIPPTAKEVAQELRLGQLSVPEDLFEPDTNIRMGTHYLSRMIKMFDGCVPMGLAAYNAGPTRVNYFVRARADLADKQKRFTSDPLYEIWFDELPWSETSFYVKAILRNTLVYKALDKGRVGTGGVLWSDLISSQTEVTGRQQL